VQLSAHEKDGLARFHEPRRVLRPVRWHGVAGQTQVIGRLKSVLKPSEYVQSGEHQQMALPIAPNAGNFVVRQAVRGGVSGKSDPAAAASVRCFLCWPQIALPILVKLQKAVADDAGRIALVKDREAYTVKAHQAVKCR